MADAWSVNADDLADVATALRYEEDGVRLRRQLAKELRAAVAPGVAAARAEIQSLGSSGIPHGESLGAAVARQVKAQTTLTQSKAGVRVRASKSGMPRGFRNAPKRLNRRAGWRHPVFGDRDRWVHQIGKPDWFDGPLQARQAEYRAAAEKAVRDMADRIKRGAP